MLRGNLDDSSNHLVMGLDFTNRQGWPCCHFKPLAKLLAHANDLHSSYPARGRSSQLWPASSQQLCLGLHVISANLKGFSIYISTTCTVWSITIKSALPISQFPNAIPAAVAANVAASCVFSEYVRCASKIKISMLADVVVWMADHFCFRCGSSGYRLAKIY
jgi:hypothetical protein